MSEELACLFSIQRDLSRTHGHISVVVLVPRRPRRPRRRAPLQQRVPRRTSARGTGSHRSSLRPGLPGPVVGKYSFRPELRRVVLLVLVLSFTQL